MIYLDTSSRFFMVPPQGGIASQALHRSVFWATDAISYCGGDIINKKEQLFLLLFIIVLPK
jgi:hypothetical protein